MHRLQNPVRRKKNALYGSSFLFIFKNKLFQGWEETTDAALTFLLRTSLAKVGKENQGATPITLDVAKDTSRIKKHVSSVIDRITKGSRIQDDKNRIEAPSPMDFNLGNYKSDFQNKGLKIP